MKKFFASLLALGMLSFPAYAQKTKSVLQTEINTNFADNTIGAVTPAIARATFTDFLNSWQQYGAVNPQIGTSYTIALSDYGQLVTINNAGAVAVAIPQATGSFSTFNTNVSNLGAGAATITPTTSTICGAATLVLNQGQSVWIISDGVNYQCIKNIGSAAGVSSFGVGARTGAVVSEADDYANYDGLALKNCTLAAGVSTNILTVSLKDFQGNDPTATSPCVVVFRNATAATGTIVSRTVSAATSVVFNVGSSLGTTNNVPFRLWIEAFDTGSTAVLAASLQTNTTTIFPFDEYSVKSSTACNSCVNATSAGVFYTTAAQTSKPWRILGFMEWSSGLATAGTWATGPTKIQIFGPGIPRPGQVIQSVQFSTQSVTTANSAAYVDTNCTASITPTSSANYIFTSWFGETQIAVASQTVETALRRAGTVVGFPKTLFSDASNIISSNGEPWIDAPGSSGSITYTVAVKGTGASNVFFPNGGGGCVMQLQEIMG